MIQIKCPTCGSSLNAKRHLVGQVRDCPKCGAPVKILLPDELADESPESLSPDLAVMEPSGQAEQVATPGQSGLPVHHWPQQLDRQHHYLICDKTKLVAAWENNGNGWMLKTRSGLVSAVRNRDQLPAQGEFKLIELRIEHTPSGRRLVGIRSYELASRWALTSLDKGDDPIMSKIDGAAGLSRDQKNAVRGALKEQFMREVWQDARHVIEYLANTDYHSPGTQ